MGTPRVVLVRRATEYRTLLARHATPGQAEFFLRGRGQSLAELERRDALQRDAERTVMASVPLQWRRTRVDRGELDRFLFEPDDVVVAVGQDGLVANVAKYLRGQPVLGVNPEPERYEGVLVPLGPRAAAALLVGAARGDVQVQARTMVEATFDDGQRLTGLNELFVGHVSHQSARYLLGRCGRQVPHSSSGIVVTTGTGATGWARSIHRERGCSVDLPGPTAPELAFFVREAFPSRATSVELTEGLLSPGETLDVVSRMDEGGVVFGDGIESDRVRFDWGMRVRIGVARRALQLVVASSRGPGEGGR